MTRLLHVESNQKMYNKTIGLETFSKLQMFFRICFEYNLGSKNAYEKLTKHYGSKANADEKIFEVCKNLMEYEMHLYRHFLNKKEVSVFMENFEKQMSIFGIKARDLRSMKALNDVRNALIYNTVKWS